MSHKQKVSIYLRIRLDGKQRFWPTVRLFAGEGDRATLIRVSLIVLEGVEESIRRVCREVCLRLAAW